MPPEAGAERLTVGQPGQRIGDRAGVQFAFETAHLLNRAHQAQCAIGRTGSIAHWPEAERVPALALRLSAGIALGAGDHWKLDPPDLRAPGQYRADMLAQKHCVLALGQIGDVREQQRSGEIQPQFGDVCRCVDDETVPVEPDDNIAGSFFKQAVQNAAFDIV
jgi:hypothetical protein